MVDLDKLNGIEHTVTNTNTQPESRQMGTVPRILRGINVNGCCLLFQCYRSLSLSIPLSYFQCIAMHRQRIIHIWQTLCSCLESFIKNIWRTFMTVFDYMIPLTCLCGHTFIISIITPSHKHLILFFVAHIFFVGLYSLCVVFSFISCFLFVGSRSSTESHKHTHITIKYEKRREKSGNLSHE